MAREFTEQDHRDLDKSREMVEKKIKGKFNASKFTGKKKISVNNPFESEEDRKHRFKLGRIQQRRFD